ncbi:hypothetical protein FQR65_LT04061 [Abscondita terminalis]|nr:hypothetical protein FQR65_LT04061 [Abscondita terminalis]
MACLCEKDILAALMGVKPNTGGDPRLDKNIFLSDHSLSSSETSDDVDSSSKFDSAMHYISPASMSPLSDMSDFEGVPGAYFYKSPSFMRFLHEYGKETVSISSTISCVEPEIQRTLAIVKPDAMKYEDVILRAINQAGLFILNKRCVHFTPEQVSEIYSQHYGGPAFPRMVVNMSFGPVLCLCMCGYNAVEKWKSMIGVNHVISAKWFYPMSMRVRFGLRPNVPDALHASENYTEGLKENRYVYPEGIIEPIMTEEDKVTDYFNTYVNPTLLKGLTEVCRVKPEDPICCLAEYLLKNNPYQPQFPDTLTLLPT